MKVLVNYSYLSSFPIHYDRIEDDGNTKKALIVHRFGDVTGFALNVNGTIQTFEADFENNLQYVEIQSEYSIYDTKMRIEYVTLADGSKLDASGMKENRFVQKLSIFTLKNQANSYCNKINKLTGIEKSQITTAYSQYTQYYHCVCGNAVFNEFDKCPFCGIRHDVLREIETEKNINSVETNKNVKKLCYLAGSILLVLIIDIILETFFNFFHYNELKSVGMGLVLRLLNPILLGALGFSGAYVYYKKYDVLFYVIISVMLAMVILNNCLMLYSSIKYSYLLFITTGYNLILIAYIVLFLQNKKKLIAIIPGLCTLAVYIVSGAYASANLEYRDGAWNLYVSSNETEYFSPSRINNVPVEKLTFLGDSNENMEILNVSKSIKAVSIADNSYLPKLKSIILSEENRNLSLNNGILYDEYGIILVPSKITEAILKSDLKEIAYKAFCNCHDLLYVCIPESVHTMKAYAFANCESLANIEFEGTSNLTTINEYVFANCTSLESIYLPQSVKNVGDAVYYGCDNVKSMTVPFIGKTRYTAVYLSHMFGARNFEGAEFVPEALEDVTIYDQRALPNAAFIYCDKIKNVKITSPLDSIGQRLFDGCTSLESVDMKGAFTTIRRGAFNQCSSLKTVNVDCPITTVEENAFAGCNSLEQFVFDGVASNLEIEIGNDSLGNILTK